MIAGWVSSRAKARCRRARAPSPAAAGATPGRHGHPSAQVRPAGR